MSSDTPSLAAVVVTCNRAAKLARVLDALAAQTRRPDVVYVIDNASSDDTASVVAAQRDGLKVVHHRLETNLGGAGGFHAGLKLAYSGGHDLFWLSDDDAYPAPDAIERLETRLAAFEAETGLAPAFACSRVTWTDGALAEMNVPVNARDWPRWYRADFPVFHVIACSFVSVLVPRRAVAEHGLPLAEYFIWHDDVEYTGRIARSGPGLYVADSLVVHDTAENAGADFGRVTDETAWKFICGARNETSRRLRDQGIYGVAVFVYRVRGEMKRGGVPARLKRRLYGAILRGLAFRPKIERV